MSNRRLFLRNVRVAYPGTLGVPTDKGIQDVKPLPLEAPTESYEIMLLRWQTGVFEVGASPPLPPPPIPPVPEEDGVYSVGNDVFSFGDDLYAYED